MTLPKNLVADEPGLGNWCILSGYRGSISHGTFVPKNDPDSIDDKDVMAVCVPPRDYYLGLTEYASRGTKEIKQDEWDVVVYEARKFFRLLQKGNPNVLTLLWTEPQYMIKTTPAGQMLCDRRALFVGKHVYHSFIGYAKGQLHRMTHTPGPEAYMGAKRKALLDRFGIDTKNAAHLIRILRMGIEFLVEGELHVLRADNNELLEIKRGEWSLERISAESDRLFALAQEAYVRSPLPPNVDAAAINALCVQVVARAWADRGEFAPA